MQLFCWLQQTNRGKAQVLKGVVVPELSSNTVIPAIGILGAIIMPHNIYLHSALVQVCSRCLLLFSDCF